MKKNFFRSLFVIFLMCTLFKFNVQADEKLISGECGDNATWEVADTDGDEVVDTLYIHGTGMTEDYEAYSSGKAEIWMSTAPWFVYADSIEAVIIDEGITYVGNYSIYRMTSVKTISIPDSIKELGEGAFAQTALEQIHLPNGLEKIGASALANCKFEKIIIPDTVVEIGEDLFYGSSELKEVVFNSNITSIPDNTFYNCDALTSITIPSTIKSIGNYAFYDCDNLQEVNITEGVESVGEWAFYSCDKLEEVNLPQSLESVGEEAFSYCTSLEKIVLPSNLKIISRFMFAFCSELSDVTIPYGIEKIEEDAFRGCSSLNAIVIPNSVTTIESGVFEYCKSIKEIVIPDSVTEMEAAFYGCSGLEKVVLSDNIKTIYQATFNDCSSLKEIVIPASVEEIQKWSFGGCIGLNRVEIKNVDCNISDDVDVDPFGGANDSHPSKYAFGYNSNFVICGLEGSTTQTFATDRDLKFEEICAHNNTVVIDSKEEPTCVSKGLTEGSHCSKCGEIIKVQTEIAAKGHTAVVDAAVAATCTNTGLTEGSHCSECGKVLKEQEKVAVTAHNIVIDKEKNATCTTTGLTSGSHCTVCGKVFDKQESIAALGHLSVTKISKASIKNKGKEVNKCSRCGKIIKETTIYSPNKITLKKSQYIYSGKAIKPVVTVYDSKGSKISSKQYTVIYNNNKTIGKASITVVFSGTKYTGKLTKSFVIIPPREIVTKVVRVSNNAKVSWKKQMGITGYQIMYSRSKSFQSFSVKTVGKKNSTYTIKCAKGKRYYVKVRAYVKVGDKCYYGAWSNISSIIP